MNDSKVLESIQVQVSIFMYFGIFDRKGGTIIYFLGK